MIQSQFALYLHPSGGFHVLFSIDLHKDNCLITTINDAGELVRQERLPNVPEIILAYFAALGGSHNTVVESTTGWYWLSDLLEAHGI